MFNSFPEKTEIWKIVLTFSLQLLLFAGTLSIAVYNWRRDTALRLEAEERRLVTEAARDTLFALYDLADAANVVRMTALSQPRPREPDNRATLIRQQGEIMMEAYQTFRRKLRRASFYIWPEQASLAQKNRKLFGDPSNDPLSEDLAVKLNDAVVWLNDPSLEPTRHTVVANLVSVLNDSGRSDFSNYLERNEAALIEATKPSFSVRRPVGRPWPRRTLGPIG